MIEGKGKFINRPTKTGSGVYDKYFFYVPMEVARDSQFPFKPGDEVIFKIDVKGKRLIIERIAQK